jgi:hypothetical protein
VKYREFPLFRQIISRRRRWLIDDIAVRYEEFSLFRRVVSRRRSSRKSIEG